MVDSTLKECYTYDTVWKDQLKTFGDKSISYDAQGNPTSYLGHTLTWTQGNRLNTFDNTSYAYNHQGLRTKKTVNGVAHTYLWEGTKLISEAWNGNTMITFYGSDGSVCGILYNDIRYYFNKNLQGDVISILNMAGNTVAKYTYDAWGKLLSVTDAQGNSITDSSHIALINPYRYRGYYFDSESNFYYLQTRYYDPETGRFISPDNIAYLNPKKFIGLNLYAYCGNNPINKCDPTGHFAISAIIKVIITIVAIAATVHDIYHIVSNSNSDNNGNNVYIDQSATTSENVRIHNSYKILTPWVKYGYGFYLNHFNADTKDVIQGSTAGIVFEWELHNLAALLGFGERAEHLDIGKSIFSDGEAHPFRDKNGDVSLIGVMSLGMRIAYALFSSPIWWIWDLIVNGGF